MEKRIYFKNLNFLRFIAATAVIFHHVEQYKFWAKLPNIWGNISLDALGAKSVSFFFVLSGFLITYLLLEEKRKTNHIRVKDFYIRRILRIWPVYYLVVIICLFIVPLVFDLSFFGIDLYDKNFTLRFILLFLVMPNVVRVFSPSMVGGNQLWSIGVEEQFYLIWPVFVRFVYKKLIWFLIAFIVAKIGIMLVMEYMLSVMHGPKALDSFLRFWTQLKIEQMAIGAVGAWAIFKRKEQLLKMIYHPATLWLTAGSFISLFFIPFHHWTITIIEAFIFLSIIINLSTNPSIKFSMESPLMTILGNISYGIYMYHTLCITTCIYVLTYFNVHTQNYLYFNLLLYSSSVILTIVIAYLSYEYMERYFFSIKERFMVVKSGKDDGSNMMLEKVK